MRPMSLNAVLQWLLLAALTVLAGGVFFERLVLSGERARAAREQTEIARLRLLSWGLIGAFVAAALVFIARDVQISDVRWTIVTWGRVVVLLLLLALLRRRQQGAWPATVASLMLLASQSALSRSVALRDGLLQTTGDWLHLTLSSAWLGGVAMLAVMAGQLARRAAPDADALRAFAVVVDRFAPIAVFCVAGLAIGGIAQAAQFLGSFEALLSTAYGRALSVKLGVFVALLGFGALHQQVLAPRLRRWALVKGPGEDGAATTRRFRVSLLGEVAGSVMLLLAVGAMKALPAAV
jgi:copper transport protein